MDARVAFVLSVNQTIIERINQRQRQIFVHSCLYYRFDQSIIDDHTYDRWSKELAELQRDNPEAARQSVYYEYFKDFDGSSGFDLPIHLEEVVRKANQLIDYLRKQTKINEGGEHIG